MVFKAIVIGASTGGMNALQTLVQCLPAAFSLPVCVVLHLHPRGGEYLVKFIDDSGPLQAKEAEEKEDVLPATIYIAPANYHLLIENDHTLSLSVDEKVNFSRPSIDVLFESAADVYGSGLVGVILTGASGDGSIGLERIVQKGGMAVVQDPTTAAAHAMPRAALERVEAHHVLNLKEIGALLAQLGSAPTLNEVS